MKASLAIVTLFLATIAICGCDALGLGGDPPVPVPTPIVAPPVPAPVAPAAPQMPVAPVAPVAAPAVPAAPAAPVAVPPYTWTETPTVETIPDAPIGGMANGKPFAVQAIIFEPGTEKWRMKIHDKTLDSPTAMIMGGQSVNLDMPETPSAGAKLIRNMEYGDGYFQINNDPANPEATTSWNADNAFAIEFTKWDVKEYDENGDLFQEAGKASGKISICYKGNPTGIQSSWVAGTFEDATVRYMGKPAWKTSGSSSGSSSSGSSSSGKKKVTTPDPKTPASPEPEKDKKEDEKKDDKKKDGTIEIDKEAAKKFLDKGLKSLKDMKKKE